MNTSDLNLATCSIRAYQPTFGVPLRTTVGMIRNVKCENGSKLAPYGLLKIEDRAEFARRYIARLDRQAEQVDTQLLEVAEKYPGETIVALCFEDLRKAWCHRTLAAAWLVERYGNNVPELSPHEGVHLGVNLAELREATEAAAPAQLW